MKIAAFLAREHGLAGLKALLSESNIQVTTLYTHRYEPQSQLERKEFPLYLTIAKQHHLPFQTIDSSKEMETLNLNADLILSISWRYRFSQKLLQSCPLGGVNIHRGALPQYRGAEPIKRALQNGKKQIVVCAHQMIEQIDAGPILEYAIHDIVRIEGEDLEIAVERIKKEITPLFALLCHEICQIKCKFT